MILLSLALVVASAAALGWGIATTSEPLVWGSLFAGLAAVALVAGSVVRHRRRLASGEAGTAAAPSGPVMPAAPPPGGAWPWPADAAGSGTAGAAPARSGWTGPVGPAPPAEGVSGPGEPAGTAEQPPADAVAASAPPAAAPPAAAPPAAAPPAAAGPAGERVVAGLGAATDRPLGEPFPPPTADRPDSPVGRPADPPADDGEPPAEDLPVRDALRVAQLDDSVQVVDGHPRYHLDGCPILAGAEPVPMPVSAARRAGFTPCAICAPDRTLLARSRDRRPPPPTRADP